MYFLHKHYEIHHKRRPSPSVGSQKRNFPPPPATSCVDRNYFRPTFPMLPDIIQTFFFSPMQDGKHRKNTEHTNCFCT